MDNTQSGNTSKPNTIQTAIAPWLSVRDGVAALAFYKTAFGATEVYRLDMPVGEGVVARLSVDGAEFWLSSEGQGGDTATVQTSFVRMILTVADPDAVFARAIAAGATEVFPVGEDHGWRLGRLVDPFGLHWEVGYQLAE